MPKRIYAFTKYTKFLLSVLLDQNISVCSSCVFLFSAVKIVSPPLQHKIFNPFFSVSILECQFLQFLNFF